MEDFILKEEIREPEFALVIISMIGRITAEYFTDYPDLRIVNLVNTSNSQLLKQFIAGYAFCKKENGYWVTKHFRCPDSARCFALRTYINTKLRG